MSSSSPRPTRSESWEEGKLGTYQQRGFNPAHIIKRQCSYAVVSGGLRDSALQVHISAVRLKVTMHNVEQVE